VISQEARNRNMPSRSFLAKLMLVVSLQVSRGAGRVWPMT
jgi:hypothetical protein